ncbi:MAG: hypothetical protein J6N21_23585 [Butyrivibrio sp.]|nr:hypothetical protein [Oscillospiraceae bacterium]MBP3199958.1 hypothetical protein [Butyrivibrio sp.]
MRKLLYWLIVCLILMAILQVIEDNIAYIIIGAIIIVSIIFFCVVNSDDKKKAEYRPVTLRQIAQFPENEDFLYFKTLLLLDEGIKSFTPHDLGVMGIQTTSTYYLNLYNKGYYDRIAHGTYAINKVNLGTLVEKYDNAVRANISRNKSASMHKTIAAASLEAYENDLKELRIGKNRRINREVINAYLES